MRNQINVQVNVSPQPKPPKKPFNWQQFLMSVNTFLLLPAFILVPPLWCYYVVPPEYIFWGIVFIGICIMKIHRVDAEVMKAILKLFGRN